MRVYWKILVNQSFFSWDYLVGLLSVLCLGLLIKFLSLSSLSSLVTTSFSGIFHEELIVKGNWLSLAIERKFDCFKGYS